MNCPKCESNNLEVKTEIIYTNHATFPIVNGKIKSLRKPNFNNLHTEDTRIFIRCIDCKYETENINGLYDSKFDDDFTENIALQINTFLTSTPKKRKENPWLKHRKFLKSNPTDEEVIAYADKHLRTKEEAQKYVEIWNEYRIK